MLAAGNALPAKRLSTNAEERNVSTTEQLDGHHRGAFSAIIDPTISFPMPPTPSLAIDKTVKYLRSPLIDQQTCCAVECDTLLFASGWWWLAGNDRFQMNACGLWSCCDHEEAVGYLAINVRSRHQYCVYVNLTISLGRAEIVSSLRSFSIFCSVIYRLFG
jgi:hypothetical protein